MRILLLPLLSFLALFAQPAAAASSPNLTRLEQQLYSMLGTKSSDVGIAALDLQTGEIVSVTPHVRGKGSIVFEFLLALPGPPPERAAWEQDGLIFALPAGTEGGETGTDSLTPSHIVRVDLAR